MPLNATDRELALQLLTAAVATDKRGGKAAVAAHLGCSRVLISRVLSPNDPLDISEKLARRVIDVYHVIPVCPATGAEQARSECNRLAQGAAPMHNPAAMRVWKTCQTCAHKPIKEGSDQ